MIKLNSALFFILIASTLLSCKRKASNVDWTVVFKWKNYCFKLDLTGQPSPAANTKTTTSQELTLTSWITAIGRISSTTRK